MQITPRPAVAARKAELRREILSARESGFENFEDFENSVPLWRRFVQTKIYADCEILLTYVSVREEHDTRPLIERALSDGKRVFAPKTYAGGNMTFFRVHNPTELTEVGRYGIPEPRGDSEEFRGGETSESVVCVIPALCYNSNLQRVGYGGGYYDRFLCGVGRNTVKVLFCDVFREFEADEFDVPADIVIKGGSYER